MNANRIMSEEAARAIATRIDNAYVNFADTLVALGNIPADAAKPLAHWYVKRRLAKLDAVNGRIIVKHGGYLDAQAIANALQAMREGTK